MDTWLIRASAGSWEHGHRQWSLRGHTELPSANTELGAAFGHGSPCNTAVKSLARGETMQKNSSSVRRRSK